MESGAVQFQVLFEIMDTWQTTGVRLQDVVQGEYRTSVFTCASDSSGCVLILSLSLSSGQVSYPSQEGCVCVCVSLSLSLSLFRTGFIPLSGGVCVCVHPDSKLRVFGVSSR